MTPDWILELHRQWQRARGRKLEKGQRTFSRVWHQLLEDCGVVTSADIQTAERELEGFEKEGRLKIGRLRYRRHNIEKVIVPLESEEWLLGKCGGTSAAEFLRASLGVLGEFLERRHGFFWEEWKGLLEGLRGDFEAGRARGPFRWTNPVGLRELLEISWKLTEREWETGTLVRSASIAIGLDSKGLEKRKSAVEAGLTVLLGEEVGFRSLGLAEGETHVELSGRFTLHFPDETCQVIENLWVSKIDTADIFRCLAITTEAKELLTIENRKTTFRQYVEGNREGRILVAATSFPTPTFCEFLRKLEGPVRHFHFGDTDPAGWLILLKLREASGREVGPYRMTWRRGERAAPLTGYDLRLLPKLLAHPLLDDVKGEIQAILENGDKGDFEQESLCFVVFDGRDGFRVDDR